jgi:hypothetical protein
VEPTTYPKVKWLFPKIHVPFPTGTGTTNH